MATALQPDNVSTETVPATQEIVTVPSSPFFVRSLDLPPGIRRDEVDSFVEVTLEEISPFSLGQVYWGYYLPEESDRILVFAAYRKNLEREASEDTWQHATLVVPGFAAVFGLKREGPQVLLLDGPGEVTAVFWSDSGKVPSAVATRRLQNGDEEMPVEEARHQVLQRAGAPESAPVTTLEAPRGGRFHKRALVFELRAPGGGDGPVAEIPRPAFWSLDIRDKEFLVAKRKEIRQNRWLWGTVVAFLVGFAVLAILEIGLFAGSRILAQRAERVEELAPIVATIEQQEELASLLDELGGQRLLPFEMLDYINRLRPRSIHFTSVSTEGPRGLQATAEAGNSSDVTRFEEMLNQQPALSRAELRNLQSARDGSGYTFILEVTFREGEIPPTTGANDTGTAGEELDAAGDGAPDAADIAAGSEPAGGEEAAASQRAAVREALRDLPRESRAAEQPMATETTPNTEEAEQ